MKKTKNADADAYAHHRLQRLALGWIGIAMAVVLTLTSRTSIGSCSAFAPPPASGSSSRTTTCTSSTTTSTQRAVFARMSEECVAAVATAQTLARQTTTVVEPPCLLVGLVAHPETQALQRTLRQYRVTQRRVSAACAALYVSTTDRTQRRLGLANLKPALSSNKKKNEDLDLPFSTATQQVLRRAGQVADQRQSPTVHSHDLFLALLEYREDGTTGQATAADGDNAVWQLVQSMNVVDENVTALTICQTLLQHLQDSENPSPARNELVTAGSGTGSSNNAKTPTLEEMGIDWTQQARDGLLDAVYGRDAEIRRCLRTLLRRRKNNVCLIGDAGVGKTAIAEGVAQILVSSQCPAALRQHRLISIELSRLVAGTKYRGEFEERLQAILQEVTDEKAPPTILFFDEIHNLVGAGGAEGGLDASNQLKPALARGQVQVMGATTIAEYRQYIEKDAALERRLQPILVREPSVEQTVDILRAVATNYERHHRVKFTGLALEAAAALSERYLNDRFLPDKGAYRLVGCGVLLVRCKSLVSV